MEQTIQIIQKVDASKQYVEILKQELDYELATLFDAMQTENEEQKQKSIARLSEIHAELGLGV